MPKRRPSGKSRKILRPCTYELGYVRQDLYACTQCTDAANGQLSGFCRGCRDACHADHIGATFELYTKRAFRCDCGNTRARNTCRLLPDKDDLNVSNERSYSHNFAGRYCRCDRPYDPQQAMAQCAMCEDWFHEACYSTDAANRGRVTDPSALAGYELTCRDCVRGLPALAEYYERFNAWSSGRARIRPPKHNVCARPRTADILHKPGALDLLWKPGFRVVLCCCRDCLSMYAAARAAYIVDRSDFVGAPQLEDSDVLSDDNEEEIASDVLDSPEVTSRHARPVDSERIPRKPRPHVVAARDSSRVLPSDLSPGEILVIQTRIQDFIRHSITTEGSNINAESLRGYLCDLKAEMLASAQEDLR